MPVNYCDNCHEPPGCCLCYETPENEVLKCSGCGRFLYRSELRLDCACPHCWKIRSHRVYSLTTGRPIE